MISQHNPNHKRPSATGLAVWVSKTLLATGLLWCGTVSWAQTPPASQNPSGPDTMQPTNQQYHPLTKADYAGLLTGQTIDGEYRFLRGNAKTYYFTELHKADGTTHYKDDKADAQGVWYTLGERKICYRYIDSREMGSRISCFWVYRHEKCYYGYSVGEMGVNGPRNYDNWSARWIVKGTGGQCAAPLS